LLNKVPNIDKAILSTHCHNDLGLAVANSLAGIQAGARQIECTINGIGERAGNAALEEVVMAIRTRNDLMPYETGINTTLLSKASKLVSNVTGFPVQFNKAIVGKNAFAHESGIHQDGMLKNRNTYEIMTPESVGVKQTSLVMGKHSGRHAFKDKLISLGYADLTDDVIENAFGKFKVLADKKKHIIKKGGLNAVIIDVKCFALKSAVDQINQIAGSIEDSNLTAVLEFGLDENYVMILYENNPIITDIFIRSQDRKTLQESNNQEEMDALVRRYMTQVKQAVQDFEQKYEKRIRNLKVVSNLQNVEDYLGSFRKNMVNTGYNLFDPFEGIKIPAQLENDVKIDNRSYFSTVMGLAFRKLDVFGYYKFVTAVKNINLLPNRENMIAQKKAKAFSNFAFKGVVGIVAVIYIVLFGFAFWLITDLNKKIVDYDEIVQTHELKTLEKNKYAKEIGIILKSLQLSKSIKSNKTVSFRVLAQIASAVPKRVKFKSIEYNGADLVIIEGTAFSDQDILKLISNLNNKKLISQASLASMTLPNEQQNSQTMKGFKIACVLESV